MPSLGTSLAAPPSRVPCKTRRSLPQTRTQPVVQAFARGSAECSQGGCTIERVLRYPDGAVRRIRYPCVPAVESEEVAAEAGDDWETLNVWKSVTSPPSSPRPSKPHKLTWPKNTAPPSLAAAAPPPLPPAKQQAAAQPTAPKPAELRPDHPKQAETIPSSPFELLRYLASDAYKQSQQDLWKKVRASYEILEGCPWPAHKPLYLLAVQQPGREAGLTHTLRTRMAQNAVSSELASVLGWRRNNAATGGSADSTSSSDEQEAEAVDERIACAEMRDGVVTFEGEGDAERYGEMLEEEGASQASVARCDSHELFRSVQSVKGVVVLLRRRPSGDAFVPAPHQLSSCLRGKNAFEALEGSGLNSVDED